jgi:hypothetical protein
MNSFLHFLIGIDFGNGFRECNAETDTFQISCKHIYSTIPKIIISCNSAYPDPTKVLDKFNHGLGLFAVIRYYAKRKRKRNGNQYLSLRTEQVEE